MCTAAGALDGREEAEATGGLLEPRLPASLAAVRGDGGGGGNGASRLLLSSGYGDLQLLDEGGGTSRL